jgi:hypothetical protein
MTQPPISVDTHLQRILETVQPLASLDLTLADAHGCILDEDVTAAFPLPPFDNGDGRVRRPLGRRRDRERAAPRRHAGHR